MLVCFQTDRSGIRSEKLRRKNGSILFHSKNCDGIVHPYTAVRVDFRPLGLQRRFQGRLPKATIRGIIP